MNPNIAPLEARPPRLPWPTQLLRLLLLSSFLFLAATAKAGDGGVEKIITSGMCSNFSLPMIPVVERFIPIADLPISHPTVSQGYDTTKAEGYTYDQRFYYGHDGLDLVNNQDQAGKNDITAIQRGLVILSMKANSTGGWGETIVIATRPNAFSDEILTHHYHHMDGTDATTTRKFNACEEVDAADAIGKEGKTGHVTGVHLHQGVRRWNNLAELQQAMASGVIAVLGYGYTFGDDAKIAKNLDPEGILFDTFSDYAPPKTDYAWSEPWVSGLRHRGIEFGRFDGRFGAGEGLKRSDAARWLKVAAQRLDAAPSTPTFADVSPKDADYPYVEALVLYPSSQPVINKDAALSGGKRYFHPDDVLNRAAALKMVILTFYSSEFLRVYNDYIWNAEEATAALLLGRFEDVSPTDWFAPYVYFGAQKGLVAAAPTFQPSSTIKREEMAKWVSQGAAEIDAELSGPCNAKVCPADSYCDVSSDTCQPIPACVPSETQACAVGGGYTGGSQTGGGSGDTTAASGGQGGSSVTTTISAAAGAGGGAASSTTTASSAQGGGLAIATASGVATAVAATTATSTAFSAASTSSGQGGGPSAATTTVTVGGQGGSATASASAATGSAGTGGCQDVYLSSPSPACLTTSGGPTLCLYLQQISGANWQYWICKSGGSFVNGYSFVLKDDNNGEQLDSYTGNAGDTCSATRDVSVQYLSGDGPSYGAGLRAMVFSPESCTQSSCQYSTGTVTVYKQCSP